MSAIDRHKSSFWSLSLFPLFRGQAGSYLQGWMFSLLLHSTAIGVSFVALGDLKLAPEPEPFTWEVSLVETSQPVSEQPAMAQSAPQPAKPEPVQQKQPMKKVVETEPQEVEPRIKEVEKPVETIHEAVTTIPRTVEPVEPPQPKTPEPVAKAETKPETKEVARAESAPPVVQTAPPPPPVRQQTVEPTKEPVPAPIQEASVRTQPAAPANGRKTDFGWLAQTLWDRVARLKRYPHSARLNHLEGRVVVRAVITESGELAEVDVTESSGHQILDEDALEVIRRACPLKLRHPLGRPHVVVQVPINYRLEN
jgi:protein TonB